MNSHQKLDVYYIMSVVVDLLNSFVQGCNKIGPFKVGARPAKRISTGFEPIRLRKRRERSSDSFCHLTKKLLVVVVVVGFISYRIRQLEIIRIPKKHWFVFLHLCAT